MKTAEEFWSRVKKTDSCWLWQGSKTHNGYGNLGWQGKTAYAHRVALHLTKGTSVACLKKDGITLHSCNVRNCVNPAHVSFGTSSENNKQAFTDGNQKPMRGEKHTLAKFTNSEARKIRKLAKKYKLAAIARFYGVAPNTISQLVSGVTYRD